MNKEHLMEWLVLALVASIGAFGAVFAVSFAVTLVLYLQQVLGVR